MPGLVEIRPQRQPDEPERPTTPLEDHLRHFHRRVLVDALLEATTAYWIRRADTFDTVGNDRCDQIALACRRRAHLTHDLGIDAEATALLDQIAGPE